MDQWFPCICYHSLSDGTHQSCYDVIGNKQVATTDNNQREPRGHCWHITEGTIRIVTTKRDVDCSRMGQLNWKTEDGRY